MDAPSATRTASLGLAGLIRSKLRAADTSSTATPMTSQQHEEAQHGRHQDHIDPIRECPLCYVHLDDPFDTTKQGGEDREHKAMETTDEVSEEETKEAGGEDEDRSEGRRRDDVRLWWPGHDKHFGPCVEAATKRLRMELALLRLQKDHDGLQPPEDDLVPKPTLTILLKHINIFSKYK